MEGAVVTLTFPEGVGSHGFDKGGCAGATDGVVHTGGPADVGSIIIVLDCIKEVVLKIVFDHEVGEAFIITAEDLVKVTKDDALFLFVVDGLNKVR